MTPFEKLIDAINVREKKRSEYTPSLPMKNSAEIKNESDELQKILDEDEQEICDSIIARISDPTVVRTSVSDLGGRIGAFFKIRREYETADTLRSWLELNIGCRIRVEGDNWYGGFVLIL